MIKITRHSQFAIVVTPHTTPVTQLFPTYNAAVEHAKKHLVPGRWYVQERQQVTLPKGTDRIVLQANSIDGRAPQLGCVWCVDDFINQASGLQLRQGAGEWDVLVYACRGINPLDARFHYPHGRDNPYTTLRSPRGHPGTIVHLGTWSYMRDTFFTFTL